MMPEEHITCRAGPFRYFLIFSIIKMDFVNRTGAEIDLHKKKLSIIESIKKYRKCPAQHMSKSSPQSPIFTDSTWVTRKSKISLLGNFGLFWENVQSSLGKFSLRK